MKRSEEFSRMKPAPYVPTLFSGREINEAHRKLIDAPLIPGTVKIDAPIKGSLRREDAAKLYELAYFSTGNALDIGTNRGLSASIIADAIGPARRVWTVDLDPRLSAAAQDALARHGHTNVDLFVEDATTWVASLRGGDKFGFAFIDHSHEYEHVRSVTARLKDILLPSAFVAFHDFIDYRNGNPEFPDYGVTAGALDGMGGDFEYVCCSGCVGVFRLSRFSAGLASPQPIT